MIVAKLDSLLERGADALERFANNLAREDGYKRQLGEELAEDAAFLRNLTPTRVAERARGDVSDGARDAGTGRDPGEGVAAAPRARACRGATVAEASE